MSLFLICMFVFIFLAVIPVSAAEEGSAGEKNSDEKTVFSRTEKCFLSPEVTLPSESPFMREGAAEFNKIIFKFIFAFGVIIAIALILRFHLRNKGYIPVSESSLRIVDRIILNQDAELFVVDYDEKEKFFIAHCKNGTVIDLKGSKIEKKSFHEQLTESTISEESSKKGSDKGLDKGLDKKN